MADLFSSGHIVDLILAFMAAEWAAMAAWRRGRSGAALDAVFALLPGACLLLALRGALTGAGWTAVAGWLAVSLACHVSDLWRRWGRQTGTGVQ
jgi:hypothetical protein